jgi:signal transduction histidine kinase
MTRAAARPHGWIFKIPLRDWTSSGYIFNPRINSDGQSYSPSMEEPVAASSCERGFERIRHDGTEADLYSQFKERWNDYQRNFVSMASHEFRTPLPIIDGHARRLIPPMTRQAGISFAPLDASSRIGHGPRASACELIAQYRTCLVEFGAISGYTFAHICERNGGSRA